MVVITEFALFHHMPFGLAAGEIGHAVTVKAGALFELDLDKLSIPLRNRGLHIAFYGVAGVCIDGPVTPNGRVALIVPHANGWSRGVAKEPDRVGVG